MIKLHDKLAQVRAAREEGEKGFTLIELLVVVIIIGILAAIAIPIFLGQQEQAKGSAVESAVTNAKTQVVAFVVENGTFPDTTQLGTIATEAAGSDLVNITIAGTAAAFCVSGTHDEVTGKSWAADDKSGVIEGTCVSNVATPAA
ncbi:type IV pilin protein [Yonghaparkia sp. Root332]|uniref:type IV pilin protein n=1 Tax=Yonghaparkia sp. Root332 TaxID=1736516 RepID=UPI0006FC55BE|nr:prepilin-type N-terminal cleavage/methylation domain-containing protein [Yonghaparkia sp. Root332]KQV26099.1 hypothetical protein ASC54_03975 [Yonghaparkia sp. Root332]